MPLSLLVTFIVAAVALATDLRDRRIPNWLTLPALVASFLLHLDKPLLALLASAIATFPFAVVYWRGGVGGGDLKLAAALGMGLGDIDAAIQWLLVTTLFGVVHALGLAAWRGRLREVLLRSFKRGPPSTEPLTIPYAPAMFFGVLYAAVAPLLR